MQKIGEGVLSTAYLDGDSITLVPKREGYFEKLKQLKVNIDLVDGGIKTLQVPSNAKLVAPCSDYPHGALTYLFVPGNVLKDCISGMTNKQKVAIGKKLTAFITELQNLDIDFDKQAAIDSHVARLTRALPFIAPYLNATENQKVQRIADLYPNFLQAREFCLTHGDLHLGNLIVNKGELTGVIDFGNLDFYVPEMELVGMMHQHGFTEKIFNAVLENYPNKIAMEDVKFLQLVHRIRYFKHSIYWDEATKVEEARKFRTLLAAFVR